MQIKAVWVIRNCSVLVRYSRWSKVFSGNTVPYPGIGRLEVPEDTNVN